MSILSVHIMAAKNSHRKEIENNLSTIGVSVSGRSMLPEAETRKKRITDTDCILIRLGEDDTPEPAVNLYGDGKLPLLFLLPENASDLAHSLHELGQYEILVWPCEEKQLLLFLEGCVRRHEEFSRYRRTRERFLRVAANIEAGISIVEDGENVYISDRLIEITGYTIEELQNMTGLDLAIPEETPRLEKERKRLKKSPEPANLEFWIRRKDGEIRFIQNEYRPLYREGVYTGWAVITHDRTGDQDAWERLRESEITFRNLAESTPMGIMIYQDAKWVYINKAAEMITGYPREELMGKIAWDIVHPTYREIARERAIIRESGEMTVPRYDLVIITKSGEEKWISISGTSSIHFGRPAGLLSVMDVTDLKATEENLRNTNTELAAANEELEAMNEELTVSQGELEQSQWKYRELFKTVPIGVFQTTLEGAIQAANPELVRILGYPSVEEVLQIQDIAGTIYTNPADRKRFLDEMLSRGEVNGFRTRYRRRDGRDIWVSIYARSSHQKDEGTRFFGYIMDITREKEAEEELRNSEEKFRVISEQNLMGVLIIQDYVVTYVNHAWAEMVELPVNELMGMRAERFMQNVHQEDRPFMIEQMARKLSGDPDVKRNYNFRIYTNTGKLRWMALYSNTVVLGGRPAILASILDITDLKETEEELRRSEGRYRELVELLPLVVAETDAEGNITYINNRGMQLTGYTRDDLEKGLNVFSILHEDDHPVAFENLTSLEEGKYVRGNEYSCRLKDGGYIPMLFYTDPIYTDEMITGFRSIQVDISQRKEYERKIKESEERFRVLHNASFGGIIIHENDEIIEANQGMVDLSGHGYDSLIGMKVTDLLDKRWGRVFFHVIKNGESRTFIAEVTTPDGKIFPVEIHSREIPYYGKMVRVSEFRDIRERIEADQERENLVIQLQQAQKMEAIGRLAGGIAHDFNNLLTAILGNAELARNMIDLNDPVQENVEEIIRTADRAAQLTRQLLAFSRRQIIEPVVINLNNVIERMDRMLKRVIGEDVALKVEVDPDIHNIMADPTQIEQLIVNLAVNARDAMPRGGELRITTSNLDDSHNLKNEFPEAVSGEYVMLTVNDTGMGIDPDILERIFEPFFTTKGEEGTGLGLSTVYGIIRQNDGYVRVHSVIEEGTSFLVIFPVTEGEPEETVEEKCLYRGETENRETILVVEDEDSVRRMIVRSLQQIGYNVLESAGGREALKICGEKGEGIDLIISDVVMPEMSGPEFVSRAEEFLSFHRVLFMSGYTEDAIVDRNVLRPDVNFISKPFGPAELTARVREILDSANGTCL